MAFLCKHIINTNENNKLRRVNNYVFGEHNRESIIVWKNYTNSLNLNIKIEIIELGSDFNYIKNEMNKYINKNKIITLQYFKNIFIEFNKSDINNLQWIILYFIYYIKFLIKNICYDRRI